MNESLKEGLSILFYEVCAYFKQDPDKASRKIRKRELIKCRQITYASFTQVIPKGWVTLADIGELIAGQDYTTVIHAKKSVQNSYDTDRLFRSEYEDILLIAHKVLNPIIHKINTININRRIVKESEVVRIKKSMINRDIHTKINTNEYIFKINKRVIRVAPKKEIQKNRNVYNLSNRFDSIPQPNVQRIAQSQRDNYIYR
jgi:hypothetical protein